MKTETLKNSGVASDNENIFIPLTEGVLKAVNPITGETIWETNVGGEIVSNILIDKAKGSLYVASISGDQGAAGTHPEVNTISLSLTTGVTKWKKQTDSNLLSRLYLLRDVTNNSLDSIFVITDKGSIDTLETDSGKKISNRQTNININTFPSAADEKLFFGNGDKLIAESSNRKDFKESTEPAQIAKFKNKLVTVFLNNNTVFIGDDLGVIYALNINGRQKWALRTGGEITDISEADNDNLLISSADNFVYLLSKNTGKRIWKKRLNGKSSGKPAVRDDITIFSPLGERIAVFVDLKKGQTVNQILLEPNNPDATFAGSPVTAGDIVILSATSGFYAFSSKECGTQNNIEKGKEKRESKKPSL